MDIFHNDVTNGVLQGSVLGPVPFNICRNDMRPGATNELVKFAEDTKLFRLVKTTKGREQLQRDQRTLEE